MNDFYTNSISHLNKIEGLFKEDISAFEIKFLSSINKLKEIKILREQDLRRYLQEEILLKDSILQKEKLLSNALQSENHFKTKQLATAQQLSGVLNDASNRQKIKLKEERSIRLVLLAGLFSLMALGILALYQTNRVKSKKEIIQKQSDELQTLMKEIHHRVKNNIQIVSSLLDLQSITQKDGEAAEAIKEGKNWVQSMALIHQHLYQEGNIRGIKIDGYIITLTQILFSSYHISSDRIVFRTDIENLNLDVDTVIPLGLIINELVSNSLKYAFGSIDKGIVSISLKEKNDSLELFVRDNGKGFPTGLDIHKNQSFGLQLITAIAQKLKARLDFYNDNGAAVHIQIKKFRFA